MITDKEREILDNAPDGATHYKFKSYYLHKGGKYYHYAGVGLEASMNADKWFDNATQLSDLRKKQGKTVVDAVNYRGANADFLTSGYLIYMNKTWAQASGGDWLEYKVCNIEEFNQCVKDMSEFAGKYEYEQYLAHIDIFGVEKLEPIKGQGYKLFVDKFRDMVKSGNLEALNELSYMANQLAEKGGCGSFDISELEPIKPRTKIEYVLLTQSNADVWGLKVMLENQELFSMHNKKDYVLYSANAPTYMIEDFTKYGVYRKVETEIKTESGG